MRLARFLLLSLIMAAAQRPRLLEPTTIDFLGNFFRGRVGSAI
jgi:hypothetical protein